MGKHGGKAHTPVMLDDNLKSKQFYRVIDLISEGPIEGPVDSQHMSSFMVNGTPITDANGNVNIPGITLAWREGSGNQTPINGLNFIESTTMVALDVKQATPLVRNISDPDVTRVRFNIGVSGLVQTSSKGDQSNATAQLEIATREGGGNWVSQKTVTITGKISGEYLEAHVIQAPATKPFDIRVSRITPDSTKDTLQNGTIWNSYTEIIDDVLSYPYSAVAGCIIDHDQYTDAPSRTYHLRGLIVDVPDNYDPINRTYSGLWTGGWKKAWTNNPAWLFRELVKNDRFGLAKNAGYIDVDDGALFTLSQFCDQPVKSGYGMGTEPRLTLNAYITEQTTARELLDKIAGMFRGMALWDGMRLTVLIDNPADPIAVISNANVVDGKFSYSSTKRSERYNAVVVSWTDPSNGWKQAKEYVSDDDMIARYGYNETTMESFGATTRGQAYRTGKWMLETGKLETKKVTFSMARDAIAFMPGDIVEIMDNNYAGARLGGRIVSHSGAKITVDAPVDQIATTGDRMGIMNASGRVDHYTIRSVNGAVIELQSNPTFVKDGTVFVLSTSKVSTRLFRIMSVQETANNSEYAISALQHDPNKQAIVDDGAVFEAPNDSLNGFRVPSVENIRIIDVNSPAVQVRAEWETATTTRGLTFELTVYNPKNNGAVVERHTTDTFAYNFFGLPAGNYQLGIKAINQMGMKGPETFVNMGIGAPPKPKTIEWKEDIFAATLIPSLGSSYSNDISFEYWMKGDGSTAVSKGGDVTAEAEFLGRGAQWHLAGLKGATTYYVYVRSRNGFGVSDFVEASGQASDNIPGMIAVVDNAIRNSNEFSILDSDVKRIDASLNTMGTDLGVLEQTWKTAKADLDKDVQAFTSSIAGINATVSAADAKIDTVQKSLEAQISAVTGGGNATFQGLVNDVQQVKTDQASQLTQIQGAVTRMNGIDSTVANQVNLWRADDAAITTQVNQVKASAAKNTADITTEQQTRAAADGVLAERITKMTSTLPADQNHPDRKALMTTVMQTETDADKALSLRIDNWQAANGDWQAKIDASTKAAADGDKALGERINNMFVTGGTDNTALNNVINNVVSTASSATAGQITRLNSRVNNVESDIQTEAQTRASADSNLSQRIDRMFSTTGTPSGDRTALLQTIATTSSTATDAVARRAAALEAKVDGVAGDPKQPGLVARVDVLESVNAGPNGSVATRLSTLETFQFKAENSGLKANLDTVKLINDAKKAGVDAQKDIDDYKKVSSGWGSRIQTLEQTGGTLNSADAQRITTLESFKATASKDGLPANAATTKAIADAKKAGTDAGTAAAGAQGTANTALGKATDAQARIATIEKTGATPLKVWTDKIDSHESTLKDLNKTISATVQTSISTSVGTAVNSAMSAEWGVKTAVGSGNQRYVAGIQLGVTSDPNNHNAVSNFLIKADNFAIYNPNNGAAEFAFATKGGQTFIKSAFIEEGSINSAHIKNAVIQGAKITGLLMSAGWGQAVRSWAFNAVNGDFGIRTGNGNQRVEINGAGIILYDSAGRERIRIGQW